MAKKATGRAAPKRHQDRERVARARLDRQPGGVWPLVRLMYPAAVRNVVDAMTERGGLSLADVANLELARQVDLLLLVRDAKKRYAAAQRPGSLDHTAPGLNAIDGLQGAALQSNKHLRLVLLAMGPALSANDMPIVVPAGMDSEAMARILDGLEPSEILD